MATIKLPQIVPIRSKEGNLVFDPPEGAKQVLIASGNKLYLWTDNDLWESITEVPDDYLPKIKETMKVKMAKLPFSLLRRAHLFFREVEEKHKAEASILYYYNPETRDYIEYVPKQKVSATSVDYDIEEVFAKDMSEKGYTLIGSIHSHPSFGASQSSTDHKDEVTFEGWHITLGHVDRDFPDFHARWVVGGKSKTAEMWEVLDMIPEVEYPNEWMEQVSKESVVTPLASRYTPQGSYGAMFGSGYEGNWGYQRSWEDQYSLAEKEDDKKKEEEGKETKEVIYEGIVNIFLLRTDKIFEEQECITEFT